MPSLARHAVTAVPPYAGGRQFKVLLSTRAPQQLTLFGLLTTLPQAKGSRTA
jgi:hypothetical protein